jgi:phytochrome A
MKTHSSRADDGPVILVANACSTHDSYGHVIGVCFVAQDMTVHKLAMDKFTRVDGDNKAIIHNPNPLIPPIFGADQFGWCSEWNAAMTKLTGFHREEVLDKMLVGEVFDSSYGSCLLKNHESFVRLRVIISSALAGKQTDKATFGFYNRNGKYIECILSAYGKENTNAVIDGVFCYIQVPSQELQHALHLKQASEQTTLRKMKAFYYTRYAINNPLSGLLYSREALKSMGLNEEQMRHPNVADHCHRQLDKLLADIDHDNITNEYVYILLSNSSYFSISII